MLRVSVKAQYYSLFLQLTLVVYSSWGRSLLKYKSMTRRQSTQTETTCPLKQRKQRRIFFLILSESADAAAVKAHSLSNCCCQGVERRAGLSHWLQPKHAASMQLRNSRHFPKKKKENRPATLFRAVCSFKALNGLNRKVGWPTGSACLGLCLRFHFMASLFNFTQCARETMYSRLFSQHSEVTVMASINHNKCSPQYTERKALSSFLSHMQATSVPRFVVACEDIHTPWLIFVKRFQFSVLPCSAVNTRRPSTRSVLEGRSAIV